MKEIELTPGRDYEEVHTVYFGGGTPSILEPEEISLILDRVRNSFPVSHSTEITLEANPDDITPEKTSSWLKAGFNRLSIGVQSFRDEDLKWMNRAHNAEQVLLALELIKNEGFLNYSIDLIYGVPGLDDASWLGNLVKAISMKVPHLSCYGLTVEPETALEKMIRLKKKEDVDTDQQARQYLMLMDVLAKAGYEQYEISNWALPGFRSRHNSSYWQGKSYFGLGPSAHAFDGRSRRWNIASNALYIKSLAQNKLPYTEEELTPTDRFNESIMIALRTKEGISIPAMVVQWGDKVLEELSTGFQPFIDHGQVVREDEYYRLTREGKLFADGIASTLFRTQVQTGSD